MNLRQRIQDLAAELEEPVYRAAIYEGEFSQGVQAGEDAERVRVAAVLRRILTEEAIREGEVHIASGGRLVTLDDVVDGWAVTLETEGQQTSRPSEGKERS